MFGSFTPLQWLALIGAAVIRIILSPWDGAFRAVISLAVAIFCGYMLPEPTLTFLRWLWHIEPDDYRTLAIILWALAGEGIVRLVLEYSRTPGGFMEFVIRIITAFRGGSK